VLDLGGADSEGERAEGAVRGGVRVTAHHGHAWLGQPQLRSDGVHDALVRIPERVQADAELGAVGPQGLDLLPARRVRDRQVDVQRRGVVVLGGDREVGPPHPPAGEAESLECLRARHLVDEVQVDVQQIRLPAGSAAHDMLLPHLLRQCAAHLTSPVGLTMWLHLNL